MDDIRRRDLTVFLQEFFSLGRLTVIGASGFITWFAYQVGDVIPLWMLILGWASLLTALGVSAYQASVPKRFRSQRYRFLWESVVDRRRRLRLALQGLKRSKIADLRELPHTIELTAQQLYVALRRADTVATEVLASEGWLTASAPPLPGVASRDRQAQELYRLADKNIAEYRSHYQGVMAGVERTEAQAAVLSTTLDTLRMRLLGYRLAIRSAETPSQDFLAAITEARMQLDAIDKTLVELELTPFPQTISVMPDSPQLREQLLGPPPVREEHQKPLESEN
ncbi:MAG: hypothetical protein KIT11_06195 [Fimbriimonadaceae bacterium]|nr:hypothetical protein [Fimbriimonadaceae bacterium]QYK55948.1 MAG: hypothetical protein KF733_00385 [Fimbriimonadaceae bacterium]